MNNIVVMKKWNSKEGGASFYPTTPMQYFFVEEL